MDKLSEIEALANKKGLILKIQVRKVLGLNLFRLLIAEMISKEKIQIWGEIKGWTYPSKHGLQLDTMRVMRDSPTFVGELIWAGVAAWRLTETKCKKARLLAIYDDEGMNKKLVRYFRGKGFTKTKEVKSGLFDLFLRITWGGAGTLMVGDCKDIYKKALKKISL